MAMQTFLQFLSENSSSKHSFQLQEMAITCFDLLVTAKLLTPGLVNVRSHMLASLFPGIVAVLMKAILSTNGTFKSSILAALISSLRSFLIVVLEPSGAGNTYPDAETAKLENIPQNIAEMLTTRDLNWIDKVNTNLEKFFKSVQSTFIGHTSEKVRFAALHFCQDLILNCASALSENCVYTLTWTLLCFERDCHDEVKSLALIAKHRIVDEKEALVMNVNFQLKFFDDCLKLSDQLAGTLTRNSAESFSILLAKIIACISVLDTKRCFGVSSNLNRILSNICSCFRIEFDAIQILETCEDKADACSDSGIATISSIWSECGDFQLGVGFKNLTKKHLDLMRQLCSMIVSTSENIFSLALDICSPLQNGQDDHPAEVTLQKLCMSSFILDCGHDLLDVRVKNQVSSNCEYHLSRAAELLNAKSSKFTIAYMILSLKVAKSSCYKVGCFLDLKAVLYKTAIFATHSVAIVASAAIDTLLAFSNVFCTNEKSVAKLIEANSDYLFSDCIIKLKHASLYPEVISVLCVIFQFANDEVVLFAKDICVECENYLRLSSPNEMRGNNSNVERIFLLLSKVSGYLVRNFSLSPIYKPADSKQEKTALSQKLVSFLREVANERNERSQRFCEPMAEENVDDSVEEGLGQSDCDPSPSIADPIQVQIAYKIIQMCIVYTATSHFKTKFYCFSSATNCFTILASEEEQAKRSSRSAGGNNCLLPMVHQFWKPTVARLRDPKATIKLKAFNLVVLFSEISKDFVRAKIAQDCVASILDGLEILLSNFSKGSRGCSISTYDKTTNDYKLLEALIQGVPNLLSSCLIVPWDRATTFKLTKTVTQSLTVFEKLDNDIFRLLLNAQNNLRAQDACLVSFVESSVKGNVIE
ncbi:uncharacterized protein LOC134839937 [Symsagittifera roscoffensis]|uniref:uncharacterized protein LOC134839937 n=1 Tax=Symsagittifera roscoffensis TaxID=84072 RepID=UPI00307B960B